jgi:putative hemolysin
MMTLFILCGIFFVALLGVSCLAYLETMCTALRLFEISQLEKRIGKYHSLFLVWRSKPERLLIAILIASNFFDVVCSVLLTEIMRNLVGGQWGLVLGVVLSTLLIVVIGNIIPKSIARMRGAHVSEFVLVVLQVLLVVFAPLLDICLAITSWFARGDAERQSRQETISEQELAFLINYSDEKGLIESDKSTLLQNVFELGNLAVNTIMIPKHEMVMLDVKTSLDDAHALFSSYRYSRIPLYEGTRDNIVGFIYQKDLFALLHQQKEGALVDFMRPILFVPESKKVNQLLREFLYQRRHLAIVVDEYGAVDGLVTLEDVLEELVGEIRDEHEEVETDIVTMENGTYLIDARVEVRRVEALLNCDLTPESAVTIGGYLIEQFQRVPRKGESIVLGGHTFHIEQANLRKIQQISVVGV